MASLNFSIIFVSCFLFGLLNLITTTEAQATYLSHYCPNTTTFTPNDTYQANLNQLLSSLSSNATRSNINGFYNTTAGSGTPASETIYGLFLCRGDVSKDVCKECVDTASVEIRNRCPTEKVSIIWYDQCLLRYSNQAIFSSVEQSPAIFMWNTQNITEQESFYFLLGDTMTDLVRETANDRTPGEKFAVKQASFTGFQTLYTLAQCTPDLTVLGCGTCLDGAIGNLQRGKRGGRILLPSCIVRYDVYQFYITPPPPPSPAPTPAVLGPPAPTTTGKSVRQEPPLNLVCLKDLKKILDLPEDRRDWSYLLLPSVGPATVPLAEASQTESAAGSEEGMTPSTDMSIPARLSVAEVARQLRADKERDRHNRQQQQ